MLWLVGVGGVGSGGCGGGSDTAQLSHHYDSCTNKTLQQ